MFTVIGRVYQRLGLHAKALPLLEQALALGRQALGPEHVRVAQSLNDLGVLHREQGNLRGGAAAARREPGAAAPAARLGRQGRRGHAGGAGAGAERSRPQRRGRAADPRVARHPPQGLRRGAPRNRHEQERAGPAAVGRGDLDGAEPLFRENLATNSVLLGADHANTATSKGNLALVLMREGRPGDGRSALSRGAGDAMRDVGRNAPNTRTTLNNLAAPCRRRAGSTRRRRSSKRPCASRGRTR